MRQQLPEAYGAHRHDGERLAQQVKAADLRRGEFLRGLDASEANCNDWETGFIQSFLDDRKGKDQSTDFIWFTPRKRECVDKMIQHYGFRTLKPVPNVATLPPATPGKCEYLVKGERRNERCGQPATVNRNGFSLCDACDQVRAAGLKQLREAKNRKLRS